MKLLKSFFAVMMVPLTLVSLLGGLFLFYKAWEFMTLPTSESIGRLIKAELPKGADKGKVLDFLKSHGLGSGELRKVTAFDKESMTDYQKEQVKSQIDLIEYDVEGGSWTASWGLWKSYIQLRFYFNKDEKLIDYALQEFFDAP